jgi:hypothetical protein
VARNTQHEVQVELNPLPADFISTLRVGCAGSHGQDAAGSLGFDSVFCYINLLFIDKSNKRSNKCGFARSLKHLKSLLTFVLAGFEQQSIPAVP